MTDRRRIAAHIDHLVTAIIVPGYGRTRRQLHEWTGGHRSAVIGASPPTGGGHGDRPSGPPPDRARHLLEEMSTKLDALVTIGRHAVANVDGVVTPDPGPRDPARLAMLAWLALRLTRDHRDIPAGDLERMMRLADRLASICQLYQPPASTRIVNACHAHESANLETEVDPHYRREHLCRWCGDFRRTHGVNPPAALVRLHDRGIKMTATILRRHGIRVVAA